MQRSILKSSLPWMFLSWVLMTCIGATGDGSEIQRYIEQEGERCKPIFWQLSRAEGFRLVYQTPEETHVTQTDAALFTTSWSMSNSFTESFLRATREQNTILIRGSRKGRLIEERQAVDAAPWFQATSLSLRPFVLSGQERITFWTLRPDTLKAVKLTAAKVARETIDAAGASQAAVKVELRADGWRSAFWKSHYWFRASDGLLLRFEGQAGPSPANRIVIAYAGGV